MSRTEKIKDIPMCNVLVKLGVDYKQTWKDEYHIIENWEVTDGWTFHDAAWKRFAYDHAWKNRPAWDQFGFVKEFLGLEDKQVFDWFCEHFQVCDDQINVMQHWNGLPLFTDEVIAYLRSRGIAYENVSDVVKVMNWWPACLVWNGWRQKSIVSRKITDDKKNRFSTLTWTSNTWIYKGDLDTECEYLFVVEWMIDFLTIRQYEKNVVGLHNCINWFDDVIKLSEVYDIIFIPDNDKTGQESKRHLDSIAYKIVNLSDLEQPWEVIKDVNDLHTVIVWTEDHVYWEMFMELLKENAQFEAPIKSVFTKLKAMKEIIKERWMLGRPWPIKEIFDDACSWVIEGKVYTIAWFSNVGKSKLAYDWCWFFIEKGYKVLFINLEVSEEMCLGNLIARVEDQRFLDVMSEYKAKESLYKKLTIKDDIYRIDLICDYVRQTMPDFLFIDFIQNVEGKGEGYEKNAAIAKTIQRLAIETGVSIFSLSQLGNDAIAKIKGWLFDEVIPKGAGEYFASSDVIFLLHSEELADWTKRIIVTTSKNKFWINRQQYVLNPNREKNKFPFEWMLSDWYAIKEKTRTF